MHDLFLESRLALRAMARRPGIYLFAVLSLALGIGANTAIYTLVNAVLLKGLPAAKPNELVAVYMSDSDRFSYSTHSYPDFQDLRRDNDTLAELAAWTVTVATHEVGDTTEVLFGQEVSGNFFRLLGLPLALGRDFYAEAEQPPGTQPVVVLGHRFWKSHFASDPGVVGRTLRLNGTALTVVGVAPAELRSNFPGVVADFYWPLPMHDQLSLSSMLESRGGRSLWLLGRLKPGVTAAAAQSQFATLAARLATAYPESNEGRTVTVMPLSKVALNPGIDKPVFFVAALLLVVALLVLLIACSNIANLLLARAADRGREIAVRLAIGSSRWHLMRQLLVESLLLALAGGVLGLLLAMWGAQLLVAFKPPLPIPIALDLAPDLSVFAVAFGLALVTGLVCGLAPALKASRPQLVSALKSEGMVMPGRFRRLSLRNVLVVWQVALSTVLLIGAGLFLRSLGKAQSIDPGFALERAVVTQAVLSLGRAYDETTGRQFYREVTERMAALPGATGVALAESLPLGGNVHNSSLYLEGRPVVEDAEELNVDVSNVGVGYFRTLGIRILSGRDFEELDGPDATPVVVINEAAAQQFWPGEAALGKRLRFDDEAPWRTVVGVVATGKYRTLGEDARPFVYGNLMQDYSEFVAIVVATDGDESTLLQAVRAELRAINPNLPIFSIKTMTEHFAFMLFPARMAALLLTAFGVLGLVLASVGLYAVVAYAVARRTREVGIRMAIGAGAQQVMRLVMGEGMALVAVGLGLGLALALVGAQALGKLLYGISTVDPITFAAVAALMATIALIANTFPALKATRVLPVEALRTE